ncbi:translation protein [Gaertneriomyces semiglobifer]|nr:translation protein [Gaertneriomyces semiglobifer]
MLTRRRITQAAAVASSPSALASRFARLQIGGSRTLRAGRIIGAQIAPTQPTDLPSSIPSSTAQLLNRPYLPHLNPAPPAIYPSSDPSLSKPTFEYGKSRRTGLVGLKKGMTAIWDEWGVLTPVTVIQIVDCEVIRTRYHSGCGSYMVEVGAVNHPRLHRVKKPQLFHFRRWTVTPKRKVTEFRVTPDACLRPGTKLVAPHFLPGQFIDIQAKSTAKGFAGVMKRWNFHGQPASHGVSLAHRSLGSAGNCQDPGRVWKGKKMPGKLGNETTTVQNLRVIKVDTKENLVYVKGAVPGTEGRFVRMWDSTKKGWKKRTFPVGSEVPFPTFLGRVDALPRELLVPPPVDGVRDPFSRQKREREG